MLLETAFNLNTLCVKVWVWMVTDTYITCLNEMAWRYHAGPSLITWLLSCSKNYHSCKTNLCNVGNNEWINILQYCHIYITRWLEWQSSDKSPSQVPPCLLSQTNLLHTLHIILPSIQIFQVVFSLQPLKPEFCPHLISMPCLPHCPWSKHSNIL
jgi:hypothetical protein